MSAPPHAPRESCEDDTPSSARPLSRPVAGSGTRPLPQPPDDQEKLLYTKHRLWVLTASSTIGFGCLAASQAQLLWHTPELLPYVPLFAFTVAYYLVSLRVNTLTADFDLKAHLSLVKQWRPLRRPSVDVFLPVCGEEAGLLHNSWTHVRRLADAYGGPITVYVLDDKDDPRLAAMAAGFGFRHIARPNLRWFKKAGNLRHGFGLSGGEYILILDADFAPRPDLLDETLPYLEADPRLGIVQSPQFFRVLDQQNWLERGAGAVQELFYRAIQVSRQSHGSAICVGSCAVYRRAALAQNGGTTLIEHSEDVHTGFDLQALGWGLRYLPLALATGICPDTPRAFHNQQYRWCMGSMSLLGSGKFWRAKLPLTGRLCYISGFLYYLHTALFTFVAPLVPITLALAVPEKVLWENVVLLLPSLVYAAVVFPLWHRAPYRLEAWAVRMMYGWAHAFAVWDLLRRRPMDWQPTGSRDSSRPARRLSAGLVLWGGGTAVVWVGAVLWRMLTADPADFALLLASGLFYALVVLRVLVSPAPAADAFPEAPIPKPSPLPQAAQLSRAALAAVLPDTAEPTGAAG